MVTTASAKCADRKGKVGIEPPLAVGAELAMGVPWRGKLLPQPFGTKVFIPPIAFAILVHRPVIAELAEVVWLGEWCGG